MSAPSIPNLLSLRGRSGPRGGSRGCSQGRGHPRRETQGPLPSSDHVIQGTDTDAAVSRLSAVRAGYLTDPYARHFVSSEAETRRLPIINRGTYVRTTSLDTLVASFLSKGTETRQIVSLGAGTDTRPFRLLQTHPGLIYHELDFPPSSRKKLQTVEATQQLDAVLDRRTTRADGSGWSSHPRRGGEYHSHGLDLRRLSAADAPPLLPGLRTDVPTLVLSECCLCYLTPDEADGAVRYFAERVGSLVVVIYEPMHLGDAFSEMMQANLATRDIRMPTLRRYRNPGEQEGRMREAGFEEVRCVSIDEVWKTWIGPGERGRVDGLEGLDEVEEWQLLASHYVVVWGSKGMKAIDGSR